MAPRCGDACRGAYLQRAGDDLSKVLAELQASGSIHFHKTLARRSQQLRFSQCEQLTLPVWFVEEHGDKFEQWIILRTLSSPKPWRVHLRINRTPGGTSQVRFRGGWTNFAAENRLKEGDSLVFVLNVDARSDFQVYIFRGTEVPEESIGFTASEEAVSTTCGCENKLRPPRHPRKNCNPSFCRRMMFNHQKGRMEVPAQFVRRHRMQLRAESVKLQGVHQESHLRVVKLYWSHTLPRNQLRLYFHAGWREFVNANGLQEGQELQFTLIADSFFTVRVV